VNPQDDPQSTSTVTVGIVSGLLLLLVIFGLQLLYYRMAGREAEIKTGDPAAAAAALRAEQEGLLEGGYRWIDREKGIVALPIERAMERVAAPSQGGLP